MAEMFHRIHRCWERGTGMRSSGRREAGRRVAQAGRAETHANPRPAWMLGVRGERASARRYISIDSE